MKKILIILALTLGVACTGHPGTANAQAKTDTVLICKSNSAHAYHCYECKGLKHCSHTLIKISKAQAIKMGYQPCKFCYR